MSALSDAAQAAVDKAKRDLQRMVEERKGKPRVAIPRLELSKRLNGHYSGSKDKKRDFMRNMIISEPHPPCDMPLISLAWNIVIPPNSTRGVLGTQASVWSAAIRQAFNNPSLGRSIMNLYAGPDHDCPQGSESDAPALPVVDGVPLVDIFRVQCIIEYNSFGYSFDPNRPSFANASLMTTGTSDLDGSIGLWTHTAYMNHACLFNAERSFIGDMILFRATKDITQGEEITTLYRTIDADYSKRDTELRTWGFSCTCPLCLADLHCTQKLTQRQSLLHETDDLLLAHPLPSAVVTSTETITHAETLLQKLQNTYASSLYTTLPRLGMARLNEWLAIAYTRRNAETSAHHALQHLRNHGYFLDLATGEMQSENAVSACQLVDAVMFLRTRLVRKGKMVVAGLLRDQGYRLYIVVNGTDEGFAARFGE